MERKIYSKETVEKDLEKINPDDRKKILQKIYEELPRKPVQIKKLQGELFGIFSMRVGNYRVLFTIYKDGFLILRIGHRKEVYR